MRPMPRLPPDTTATLPWMENSSRNTSDMPRLLIAMCRAASSTTARLSSARRVSVSGSARQLDPAQQRGHLVVQRAAALLAPLDADPAGVVVGGIHSRRVASALHEFGAAPQHGLLRQQVPGLPEDLVQFGQQRGEALVAVQLAPGRLQ